jgi:cytochrome c553
MKDYRSGQRKNDTMKAMLASVSDADMNHIALFFALQKPARAQTPAQGDADAGKAATSACAGCHGDQGVSGNPATPSLAGQDAAYLVGALRGYKNATRNNETMGGLAGSLDDAAMKNIAAYYAALEPQPVNIVKPQSPDEWAQKCDRCHGIDGNSSQPNFPALAAQRMDYLDQVLHDYQSRVRRNSEMAAMADVLTDDDIKGLAAHYSREKARAMVFVTVPGK